MWSEGSFANTRRNGQPPEATKATIETEVEFLGFALGDCTVDLDQSSAKYLRVVHGTALELAVHNQFGAEVGGFWLLSPQITQLRRLPEYYSPDEAPLVEFAIEAYLAAQIREFRLI